jgi:uncharacterized membrane protein YkoI
MATRLAVLTFLAAATLVGCANPTSKVEVKTTDAGVVEEEPGLFAQATISPEAATEIAKGRVQGYIKKAELEREDGALIYSFDIKAPEQRGITEVHVDAMSGAVLKVEHEEKK